MLLKNNTGGVSKIGYLVKADEKDRTAFVYADANSTNILGVVTQSVPKYGLCDIKDFGTAKVFVFERVAKGSVIRAQKSNDRITRGTTIGAKASDLPYLRIGTALNSGKGLIDVSLNIAYILSIQPTTEFLKLDQTTQQTTVGTLHYPTATFGTSANYTEFESDGTIKFNGDATVWDDLRILPSQFDRPGTTDPTIQDWQPGGSGTTFKVWCFNQGQAGYFTIQIPHGYKTGTNLYAHVHWTPHTRGNEENGKTVAWKLDYSWANINGNFGASATIDMTDTCDGTDHKHQMTPEISITGTDKSISSMLVCKIYRDATDNWVGTGANGPALLELDFHYQLDTVGSREQSSK